MLSLDLLRKKPKTVANFLKTRGIEFDISQFNKLENERKSIQTQIETLQYKRNNIAREIGYLKACGGDFNAAIFKSNFHSIPENLKVLKDRLEILKKQLHEILISVPNIPDHTVPMGNSNSANIEVRRWDPRNLEKNQDLNTHFPFPPRDHVTLGKELGLDFSLSAQISGSRFCFLQGKLARLHRALTQFMLDVQVDQHGYIECYTPFIVNSKTLFGTGQLPRFREDMFIVNKGGKFSNKEKNEEQYLISTSEITLTNSVRNSIIPIEKLPIKLTAHTPCFRSEAGSSGKDARGLIRLHQFDKVELVSIAHPESSYDILENMVWHAEYVLQLLEIPYRVILLCTGEMGFSSAKTYDIEVWLPGHSAWVEISSISNCETFQARRMKARFRDTEGRIQYPHTLNGSALAVGRSLAAILENHQKSDGSIVVPKVLQSYMNDIQIINPK